jgi:fucose 4-O-acetylase-like acetyltransferase
MALSKPEKYARLSMLAGVVASICVIIWIIMFCGLVVFGSHVHRQFDKHSSFDLVGVSLTLLLGATLISCVTCLAAGILSYFKSKEPESETPNNMPDSK